MKTIIERMAGIAPTSRGAASMRKWPQVSQRTATADALLKQTFAAHVGQAEIRPGQANLLALMRRLAPGFMNRQLWNASKKLVPAGAGQAASGTREEQAPHSAA
jgi:hypothetical protein